MKMKKQEVDLSFQIKQHTTDKIYEIMVIQPLFQKITIDSRQFFPEKTVKWSEADDCPNLLSGQFLNCNKEKKSQAWQSPELNKWESEG